MTHVFSEFSTDAILQVGDESLLESHRQTKRVELFTFIRTKAFKAEIIVDSIPFTIDPHSVLALTNVQYLQFIEGELTR